MKLSISKAWDEAREVLARDGGLLATVALALFVVPGVIGDLFAPEATPGELPGPGLWMVPKALAILVGLIGQLAVIRLAMGTRITVGEAIGHGARRAPAYVAATLIWVAPFIIALTLLVKDVTPANPSPGAVLAMLILVLLMLFIAIRLLMTSPVASAETIGPIAILKRSWTLTSGNWWRLFAFFLLFLITILVVMAAVGAVIGIIAALLLGETEPLTVGALVIASFTQLAAAAITVVFMAMLARIYVQLAGEGASKGS